FPAARARSPEAPCALGQNRPPPRAGAPWSDPPQVRLPAADRWDREQRATAPVISDFYKPMPSSPAFPLIEQNGTEFSSSPADSSTFHSVIEKPSGKMNGIHETFSEEPLTTTPERRFRMCRSRK